MFRKILVCLDGSGFSEQILQYASEEATGSSKKIVLLRAVPISLGTTIAVPGVVASIPPTAPTPEELAEEENEARVYLQSKAKSLQALGIDVECVVLIGNPGESIVEYADKNNVDLIAIATHGRSGVRRIIFGSVAEHIIKTSKLPILLVKPK